MVRNTEGGSKAKGYGRKFITAKASSKLRTSENEAEVYAQVVKILGGAMCQVLCIDGKNRLCHIRGKFRGRGKRDNLIAPNTWILIGLREWESGKEGVKGKLENCDLLEVYNDHDKDTLKNTYTSYNWQLFITNETKTTSSEQQDSLFEFTDERTEEYRQLIESQLAESKTTTISVEVDDEIINVDDI